MAANEVYLVTPQAVDLAEVDAECLAEEVWQATARPDNEQPLTKNGLYVFRKFHVPQSDAAELVKLSRLAWQTFESGDDYATQPVGLFQPEADSDGVVRMQLITWYDGFTSWETSRAPDPEAVAYFRRRRDLTLTTYAVATRLVT